MLPHCPTVTDCFVLLTTNKMAKISHPFLQRYNSSILSVHLQYYLKVSVDSTSQNQSVQLRYVHSLGFSPLHRMAIGHLKYSYFLTNHNDQSCHCSQSQQCNLRLTEVVACNSGCLKYTSENLKCALPIMKTQMTEIALHYYQHKLDHQ